MLTKDGTSYLFYVFVVVLLTSISFTQSSTVKKVRTTGGSRPGSPVLSIDKFPPNDGGVDKKQITMKGPDIGPIDDLPTKSSESRDGDELVYLRTELKPNGDIDLNFTSHGKRHEFQLADIKSKFADVPIRLLGATAEFEDGVINEMKNIKLMKDSKRGAIVALEKGDDNLISVIKAGSFRLGKHQFDIKPDDVSPDSGKAKVSRRRVEDQSDRKRDNIFPSYRSRTKRDTVTITPISATVELVLIIDYSIWNQMSSGDITAANETSHVINLLLYYAHMTEIMNDHYGTMKNDDIDISVDLAGVVVLTNAGELSQLVEDYKVSFFDRTFIDSETTLERLTGWLNTSEAGNLLPPYDHVMLFTAYDMYDEADGETGTVGLAWTGTICDPTLSSSLVEVGYLLSYDASTAAHELGHSLGALHDGTTGSSAGCSDENYVMAAYAGNADDLLNRFLFTCCSQRSFYATIAEVGSCLLSDTSVPNHDSEIDDNVAAYLPGQIFSADDQCYISDGTEACGDWVYSQTNSSICLNLWCVSPRDSASCTTSQTAAVDGTTCATGKYCYQGECVDVGQINTNADQHCDVRDCYANEVQCADGSNSADIEMLLCYPAAYTCDGAPDCTDASDESGNCSFECPADYFKCTAGTSKWDLPEGIPRYCIHDVWVCDGSEDCTDGSEEGTACSESSSTSASSTTTTSPGASSSTSESVTESSSPTTLSTAPTSMLTSSLTPTLEPAPSTSTNPVTSSVAMSTSSGKCYLCKDSDVCVITEAECSRECPNDSDCVEMVKQLNAGNQVWLSFLTISIWLFIWIY